MLTTLLIKDFAIIDRLELALDGAMTVITGETGAGKSIVINALNLLLGGRASTEVIRAASDKAVVEGLFRFEGERAEALTKELDGLGIDFDGELVVRRIVSRAGRNRVLINGSLATLATLRGLMRGLVDISGQHEHYSLMDSARHAQLLDRSGELSEIVDSFGEKVRVWNALRDELATLREAARDRLARMDYLSYQLRELEEAELDQEEEAQLSAERQRLSHAESLQSVTNNALHALYERDGAICEVLDALAVDLDRAGDHAPELARLAEQLNDASAIAQDVVQELRHLDAFEADPRRLDVVENRLATLERLQRKFGCDVAELIEEANEMRQELERLESSESRIEELEATVSEQGEALLQEALSLSKRRRAHAIDLAARVEGELASLGMAACSFQIAVEPDEKIEALRPSGVDRVEFLLAPNPGEAAKPLARIASGGELSRVMLAIKQVLVQSDDVATYVFDEVDAGIGGEVATQVARALHRVSRDHQVLVITHLAVIASHAVQHWAVSKSVVGERTVSQMRRLDEDERVREIARMLGGLSITDRSLDHAAEMVRAAQAAGE